MNTQVIFKLDKRLKELAMKKAQHEGLPFGMVLKLATKAFVEGTLHIGLIASEPFNSKTSKKITRAIEDIKEKKNLSPRFSSTKTAIAYLKS